jgi:hypothetical protein
LGGGGNAGVLSGAAVSFFVRFENGFTVFYNGHSTLMAGEQFMFT